MPNLRSSPAADISREFQTGLPPDVRTRPYISYEKIDISSDVTVQAGTEENIDILAPEGYIYEIVNGIIHVSPPDGATSGEHSILVIALSSFTITKAVSSYNKYVWFYSSNWISADIDAQPSANQLHALQSASADEDSPITIRYRNDTDVAQTDLRVLNFLVRKVKV